jgi:hypothetical protein
MKDIWKKDLEEYIKQKKSQDPLNEEICKISSDLNTTLLLSLENIFLLGQASIINMLNDFFKEHTSISKDCFNDIAYESNDKLKEYIKKLSEEEII